MNLLARLFAKRGASAPSEPLPREGDVFLLPLSGEQFALGQLVSIWNDELYAVFYQPPVTADAPADSAGELEPVLAVLTLDAKLWNGEWPLIGNYRRNLEAIPQPVFRVMHNGSPMVEARDRSWWRAARGDEFARLQFRSISSPAVVEDIVRAHFGIGEWLPGYDRYLYGHAVASASVRP